jgi:hypothetical protein
MPPLLINIDPVILQAAGLKDYWLALGEFIHRFARVEQQVAYTLTLYTKLPIETARAVFSGVRAKDAFSLIDRIRETRGLEIDEDWLRAKAQFGVINSVRNDIVHLGAILEGHDQLQISNKSRTIPSLVKTTPISAKELNAMSVDLSVISETLYAHQLIETGKRPDHPFVMIARTNGRAPWQYKPPQQAPVQRKRGGKKGKQKAPPKSSPEKR